MAILSNIMKLTQSDQNRGHEVVESVIYGPVHSRRYGKSLGINLLSSDQKTCTFNCIYCQLGWTDKSQTTDFPDKGAVLRDIDQNLPGFLAGGGRIDNVVVSGNGEPTLHPAFQEITRKIIQVRDAQPEKIPLICFTNGTRLDSKSVLEALSLYDECCVKIDADIRRVCLPKEGFDPVLIKEFLKGLDHLVIQSCFMTGAVSNVEREKVAEWIKTLIGLKPKRIDLYTLSRNTPNQGLLPVTRQVLTDIAEELKKNGFESIRVFA